MTRQALEAAIDVCGPGVPFRAIGSAISSVADRAGGCVGHNHRTAGSVRCLWSRVRLCVGQTGLVSPACDIEGHATHSRLCVCCWWCCWCAGMYVNRNFVGHGIGRQFHAAPAVLHHRNMRPGSMQLHQTFTIEPILALGTVKQQPWALDPTGWVCVTPDASLAAQFEHTVLVTDDGAEVLTQLIAAVPRQNCLGDG